jgi:ABC-type bacteriocin/lantibiotic exporter with double-glycine peptidase domain
MIEQLKLKLRSIRENMYVLSWVVRLVKEYRLFLCLIFTLNLVQMLMGIFFSVYVKQLIDTAYAASIRPRLAFYAALLMIWTVIGGIVGYWITLYEEKIAFSMRKRVFHAVLRADWLKIARLQVGDMNSRISRDAGEISDFVCGVFPNVAGALMQLIVTAVIVYTISPPILIILMAGAGISTLMMLWFRLKLKPLQIEMREREVASSSYQTELCTNLLTVKSLCDEESAENRFVLMQERKLAALQRKSRFAYISNTVLNSFFNMGYLLVFSWAVLHLGRGEITYGTLSMIISLEGYIQGPTATLAASLPSFVRMLVSADRLNDITDMDVGEREKDEPVPPQGMFSVAGHGLSFTYPEREQPVLRDFDFSVPAGAFAVIRGPSGCGKTTLLHLILGLIKPNKGALNLIGDDGTAISTGRAARKRMGYVPQGNTLFSGTILENICFGQEMDEKAARDALLLADALSFVDDLPEGIHTQVQENSRGISVGQAQRISIARALYRKPALLILDEATSALDSETEKRILDRISRMSHRPTVLCVTHRDAALKYATHIIRMGAAFRPQRETESEEA